MSTSVTVVILGLALAHLIRSTQVPVDFVKHNGLFIQWMVSYGVALALQLCVLFALHLLRSVVNMICSLLWTVTRSTVWCKPVRQFVRPRLRSVTHKAQAAYAAVPAIEWLVLMLLVSAMIVGTVMFDQQSARISGTTAAVPYAGRLVQVAALLFLLPYALFLIVLVTAILWPQVGSSRLLTPMIALCLPGT